MRHRKDLIEKYQVHYYNLTGKRIKVYPMDNYETICHIPGYSMDELVLKICEVNDWDFVEIKKKGRKIATIAQRHLIQFMLSKYGYSQWEIARYFKQDRSTVSHAVTKIESQLDLDSHLYKTLVRTAESIREDKEIFENIEF